MSGFGLEKLQLCRLAYSCTRSYKLHYYPLYKVMQNKSELCQLTIKLLIRMRLKTRIKDKLICA